MEGNNNSFTMDSKGRSNGSSNHGGDHILELDSQSDRLTHGSGRSKCLPQLFERGEMGFLNPRFDSSQLERLLGIKFFPQSRRKFRCALGYVTFSCLAWIVFFGITNAAHNRWPDYVGACASLIVVSILFFILTFFNIYSRHYSKASMAYAIVLCLVTLLRFFYQHSALPSDAMSSVGSFCSLLEVILLLYNLLPLPLYLAVCTSILYSVVYEALFLWKTVAPSVEFVVGKIFLHVCVHLVCISVHLMLTVKKHSTFLKIGQSTMARKQLKDEKRLKEDIIYSLMPENVAKEAMQNRTNDPEHEVSIVILSTLHSVNVK